MEQSRTARLTRAVTALTNLKLFAIVINIIVIIIVIITILHNYCITTTITSSVKVHTFIYITLFNVQIVVSCKRLSEMTTSSPPGSPISLMSTVGLRPRLMQAASTAEHVSLWGHSKRKWVTVSGLLQESHDVYQSDADMHSDSIFPDAACLR